MSKQRAGELAEAEALFLQSLSSQPRNGAVLRQLAIIAGKSGRLGDALKWARQAVKYTPNSAEAHSDLGELLRRDGQSEQATKSFETALRLDPACLPASFNLGLVRFSQTRFADAAECFQNAIRCGPDFADGWQMLGKAREQCFHRKDAIAALRQAVILAPKRSDIRCSLGGVLLKADDDAGAEAEFSTALTLDPGSEPALRGLAAALTKTNVSAALSLLRRAIAQRPADCALYLALGETLYYAGDFAGASRVYREALCLQPGLVLAYVGLAHCRKIGPADADLAEAMRVTLATPGLDAESRVKLHFALGKAMDDLGRYEAAMSQYDAGNLLWLQSRPWDRRRISLAETRARHSAMISGLIERFDAAAIGDMRRSGDPSDRPIFVLGMMRSGTTLVEQILAGSPDVYGAGELAFWTDQIGRLLADPRGEIDVAALCRDYRAVLDRISASSVRVINKTPHNFFVLGLIHGCFPNAKIIHCIREPIDNCLSIYFTNFSEPYDFAYDKPSIVAFFKDYRRIMDHWRHLVPGDCLLDVAYEELVADPDAVTRKMLSFCRLPWRESCRDFGRAARTIHTASAWQARQPIYRSSAGRWRHYAPWLAEFRPLAEPDAR